MATIKIAKWMLPLFTAILFSCNTDEYEGMGDGPVAVQFGSEGIAATRTITTSADVTQWKLGDPIGIFMLKNGQTLSEESTVGGAYNREYKAENDGETCSFTPVSGIPVYYPQDGGKVDFIAYYPYKTPLSGYALPIDVSDQSDASKIDVLYSNNAIAKVKSGSPVELQFEHALSKLSFTLTSGKGSPNLTGAKVEINGVAAAGTMDLANGMAAATGSVQTITANTAANGLTSSAVMIPQTLSEMKLKITLDDGVSVFEWTFTTSAFEKGKEHKYTVIVDKTGITVEIEDITNWTGTDAPPTVGVSGILYSVGDYYPDPLNSATAIGVVFWVDPADSRHGKVLGLGEKSNVIWSGLSSKTNATDMTNGRENMATIHALAGNFADYPAFEWVHSLNPSNTDYSDATATGVWYLPARDELQHLYCAWNGQPPATWGVVAPGWSPSNADKENFNDKLTSVGGTGLGDYAYWSSSENGKKSAWIVSLNNGNTNSGSKNRENSGARCVLAF